MRTSILGRLAVPVLVGVVGCGGESGTVDPTTVPSRIELTASKSLLSWIGDVATVSARVLDASGGTVAGVTPVLSSATPDVISIDGSSAVAVGPGAATISASAAGLTNSLLLEVVQKATGIVVETTTLEFQALEETVPLSATVVDAAGFPIRDRQPSWTSTNPSVASVDESGRVRSVGVGLTSILGTIDEVTITVAVTVSQVPVVVNLEPSELVIVVGDSGTLVATVLDANSKEIGSSIGEWSSESPGTATVSTGGVVYGISLGETVVSVSYGEVAASAAVRVVAPLPEPARVTIAPAMATVDVIGGTAIFEAVVFDQDDQTIPGFTLEWSVDAPAVASVSKGIATAIAVGRAFVEVRAGPVTAEAVFNVDPTPASIAISPRGATGTFRGQLLSFQSTIMDAGGTRLTHLVPTWAVRDQSVANSEDGGSVGVVGDGDTWLVASLGALTDSVVVSVLRQPSSISAPSEVRLEPGEEKTIDVLLVDAGGAAVGEQPDFTWRIDDPSVATVDGAGRLSGVMRGSTVVHVSGGGFDAEVPVRVGGAFIGRVEITSPSDLEAFRDAGYSRIVGDLRISGGSLSDLSGLEALSEVTEDLWIFDNPALADISALDGLKTVGGELYLGSNPRLASLSFPLLSTVGRMNLRGPIKGVSDDWLPALAAVGRIKIVSSFSPRLNFPVLTQVPEGIRFSAGTPQQLREVSFPVLDCAGGDIYLNATGIEVVDLPALTRLTGSIHFCRPAATDRGRIDVLQEQSFRRLSAPLLPRLGGIGVAGASVEEIVLSSLEEVGGKVSLVQVPNLNRLDLSAWNTGRQLHIDEAGALREVILPEATDFDLRLENMPALRTIQAPKHVGPGRIRLTGMDALETIEIGAGSLEAFSITRSSLSRLPSLSGIEVGAELLVEANPNLRDVSTLSSLSTVKNLAIRFNEVLSELDLSNLEASAGGVWISDNAALSSIQLDVLSDVGGGLVLQDNATVTQIRAPLLETVGGDVRIVDNPLLHTLEFGVTSVSGAVVISHNDALSSIQLDELSSVSGDVSIRASASLTQVRMPLLENVGANLYISDNPSLHTLEFGVTSVSGSLVVAVNAALTTLSGFAKLTSGLTSLSIETNPSLTTLAGLNALGSARSRDPILKGDLSIQGNTSLPSATVEAFLDLLEGRFSGTFVAGTITTKDNGG